MEESERSDHRPPLTRAQSESATATFAPEPEQVQEGDDGGCGLDLRRAKSAPARLIFSDELEDIEGVKIDITEGEDRTLRVRVREPGGGDVPELVLDGAELQRQFSTDLRQISPAEVVPALLSRLTLLDTPKGQEAHVVGLLHGTASPLQRLVSYQPLPPTELPDLSPKLTTAEDVAGSIASSSTVVIGGFNGSMHAELLTLALGARFAQSGAPKSLTLLFGVAQGNKRGRGLDALAQKGLVKRLVFGHLGTSPMMQGLVRDEHCEAFNLPLGVLSQLFRSSPHPIVCAVGVRTDHDPAVRGCAVNERSRGATPPVVKADDGDGLLKYLPLAADVALLRGTSADTAGNVSLEDEAVVADVFAQASHCHCRGGKVFVQVLRMQQEPLTSIDIPASLVDGIVVATPEHHWQTFATPDTSPSLRSSAATTETVAAKWPVLGAGWRRVVASRAALELRSGETVNLGLGAPEKVAQVLDEAGLLSGINLTTEAGTIGGRPRSGLLFGAATHPDMVVSTATMFDMYDQGFLDVTVLGMGQIDRNSVNVGRFQGRCPGVGGFPNIAIAAKRLVIFVGRHRSDASPKFVEEVESVSVCLEEVKAQRILIVTERCVLQWRKDGVVLLEVAPGETAESVASSIPYEIEIRGCKQMAAEVFSVPFAP